MMIGGCSWSRVAGTSCNQLLEEKNGGFGLHFTENAILFDPISLAQQLKARRLYRRNHL